jgi:hypothetical protein
MDTIRRQRAESFGKLDLDLAESLKAPKKKGK